MNKTELIAAIAEKAGLTKTDSKKALDAFQTVVKDEMKAGNKVAIIGFGTFSVTKREKRTGTNPRTKERITIPAKSTVRFKPGSELELK
ncbi:HU family DNA-binding protein [Porphyromonas canoris]|uniref:DNA-binding protein n=1 Tax=Porphyromonas canoris TaxID=36875 RepID=A0ABR4XND3_9PORP|nr:HU family DNA-binding protein [Porphyromonas canoris]KGN93432.1 DNA-binding protein [Porphyromonas canoris]